MSELAKLRALHHAKWLQECAKQQEKEMLTKRKEEEMLAKRKEEEMLAKRKEEDERHEKRIEERSKREREEQYRHEKLHAEIASTAKTKICHFWIKISSKTPQH